MNKVILTTVTPPGSQYLQLALYNLKAYAESNIKIKNNVRIEVDTIYPSKKIFLQGDNWPYFDNQDFRYYAEKFIKKKPKIIGFSCFCWNIDILIKLSKIIKESRPDSIIVFGGPEVTIDSEKILKKEKIIDMIVRDEGEETFLDVLKCVIFNEVKINNIKGLTFKLGKKIIKNPDREAMKLDKIPSPYLSNFITPTNNLIMTIETSRGCGFRCAYCSYSIQTNSILRFFPIKRAKLELELLLKKNVKNIWINDDNFNIHSSRAIDLLKHIKKYRKETRISAYINASMWKINTELIHLLKQNDIKLAIGVQSINKKALSMINRPNNLSNLGHNLREFDKNNLSYLLQFIAGLPGDSYQDLKKTIDWASQFNARQICIFLLMLRKGTQLFDKAKLFGLKLDVRRFPYNRYIKETKEINRKDILKVMKFIDTIELLYNKGILKKTIMYLVKNYNLGFSDIIEEWDKSVSIEIFYKRYLRHVQLLFIHKFVSKYKITIHNKIIKKLLENDLNVFMSKYKKQS